MLFLLGLMLLAFSCSKDSMAPAEQNETIDFRGNATVPFDGVYSTYPEIISDQGGILTAVIPSTGKASHLGKSEWFSISLIDTNTDLDPTTPVPEWRQTGEDMYFTAANGDKLYGDFIGISIPGGPENPFSGYGDFTITHGTGRLTGYTGSGTYYYSVNAEFVGTLVWEGTLTKP